MSSIFGGIYYDDKLNPAMSLVDKNLSPLSIEGTISFDTSQRHCIGWHDLSSGKSQACPDKATTDNKYDTCPACQKRTGFNPAFYHATSISPQQEARNAQPHILYLAYMGSSYVKVGISWAQRGIRRLLDQGARSAIILDTFSTALIARQYEASIANLPNIHETTPTRTKLQLLAQPYDQNTAQKSLLQALVNFESSLKTKFNAKDPIHFDEYYQINDSLPANFTELKNPMISGKSVAIIGDILFMQHNDRHVALPLKRFTGYKVSVTSTIAPLELPAEQVSLFG